MLASVPTLVDSLVARALRAASRVVTAAAPAEPTGLLPHHHHALLHASPCGQVRLNAGHTWLCLWACSLGACYLTSLQAVALVHSSARTVSLFSALDDFHDPVAVVETPPSGDGHDTDPVVAAWRNGHATARDSVAHLALACGRSVHVLDANVRAMR